MKDDEAKLRQEQDRGHRAQAILEEPLFIEAVQAVRDEAHKAFKAAKPEDTQALQTARLGLEVTERLLTKLTHHMRTGQLASERLGWIEAMKERARRRRAA